MLGWLGRANEQVRVLLGDYDAVGAVGWVMTETA